MMIFRRFHYTHRKPFSTPQLTYSVFGNLGVPHAPLSRAKAEPSRRRPFPEARGPAHRLHVAVSRSWGSFCGMRCITPHHWQIYEVPRAPKCRLTKLRVCEDQRGIVSVFARTMTACRNLDSRRFTSDLKIYIPVDYGIRSQNISGRVYSPYSRMVPSPIAGNGAYACRNRQQLC